MSGKSRAPSMVGPCVFAIANRDPGIAVLLQGRLCVVRAPMVAPFGLPPVIRGVATIANSEDVSIQMQIPFDEPMKAIRRSDRWYSLRENISLGPANHSRAEDQARV